MQPVPENGISLARVLRFIDEATDALNRAATYKDPAAPPWTMAWLSGVLNREQGRHEEISDLLFTRQAECGHQQTAERDLFFDYAEELGLDAAQFEEDFDDPATLARIERDQVDGQAAGVTGTPTFFLDGEKVTVDSMEAFRSLIDEAVK